MISSRKMNRSRPGLALIYATISMVALTAIISLAVDYARVQVAKTQLQAAADAAARYGAQGLKNILNGNSAAGANATVAAKDNSVDGTPLALDPSDVQLVIWNSATKTYTVTTDPTLANGVRVSAHCTAARGTAIPLMFGKAIGAANCDINATAIAFVAVGANQTYTVKATGNPFLAGMPNGSIASNPNPHNNPDYAGTASNPRQSPLEVTVPITPGQAMTFDGINGGANNSSQSFVYDADGNTGQIESNYSGNDNHFGNTSAPLNCLVGVFLDDNQPNNTTTPANTDFSSAASRDFTSLSPSLKQIFFIGDGRDSSGEVQTFVPPAGATRLFLATWDGYEWNNNIGSLSVSVHLPSAVSLVK